MTFTRYRVRAAFVLALLFSAIAPTALAQDWTGAAVYTDRVGAIYKEALDTSADLDRAEFMIDDHLAGDVSEKVLRRELRGALSSARAEIDGLRARLRDLPPPPADIPAANRRAGRAMVQMTTNMVRAVDHQIELLADMRGAAMRGEIDRYEALSARAMRLTMAMLSAENAAIDVRLVDVPRTHPEHALLSSVLAINKAIARMVDATADLYETGSADYAAARNTVNERLDDAERALSQGRTVLRRLSQAARTESARDRAFIGDIVASYRASYRIEAEIIDGARAFTRIMARLDRQQSEAGQAQIEQAAEIFSAEIPQLVERRMQRDAERRRMLMHFLGQ